jgi:hypothetical protein
MGIESDGLSTQEADIAVIRDTQETADGRRGEVRRRPKGRQTVMDAGATHPDATMATRLH